MEKIITGKQLEKHFLLLLVPCVPVCPVCALNTRSSAALQCDGRTDRAILGTCSLGLPFPDFTVLQLDSFVKNEPFPGGIKPQTIIVGISYF